MSNRHFVYEENTLVYHIKDDLYGVLAASIIRGGRDWMAGPFHILPHEKDSLRKATVADFKSYRGCHKYHLTEA